MKKHIRMVLYNYYKHLQQARSDIYSEYINYKYKKTVDKIITSSSANIHF